MKSILCFYSIKIGLGFTGTTEKCLTFVPNSLSQYEILVVTQKNLSGDDGARFCLD